MSEKNKKIITIVFAQSIPSLRIYKIALALKRTGQYRTILLAERDDAGVISRAFDKTIFFSDPTIATLRRRNKIGQLFYRFYTLIPINSPLVGWLNLIRNRTIYKRLSKIVKDLENEVDLFHAVTEPNIIPASIIKNSSKPVIYDVYDFAGIRYGLENLNHSERALEKFCLENASAIVMKFPDWILNYYKNKEYKINCPVFNFIDYCFPDFFFYESNKIERDNIHIVYAGGVDPSAQPQRYYGNNQFYNIIKEIVQQNIYFHIYLPSDEVAYADYYKFSRENKYIILHQYKSQPELQREISNFNFGCSLNDFHKTKHTKLFAQTSFGNKYSTYLEAGLPIIVNEDLKLNAEYVEKYGVGFSINLKNLSKLSEKIIEIDYQRLKNNVKMAREESLNISNNIERISNFYKKIILKQN